MFEFTGVPATRNGTFGEHNEDIATFTESGAWVIDGATGLTNQTYTSASTDGQWFAQQFDDHLRDRIDRNEELSNIVLDSIKDVREKYYSIAGSNDINKVTEPSGAIAIVRPHPETELEFFVLGDCSVVASHSNDTTTDIFGEGPREYDKKAIEKLSGLVRDGRSHREAFEEIKPMLREHRRLKNTPDGYWGLGFSTEAVEHARTGTFNWRDVRFLCLFTDGFEQIVQTFNVFCDWSAALNYIETNGVERSLRVLSDIQRSDPDCHRYPRLKPSDDMSLIALGEQVD